jgi:hypothetical protein
MAMIGVESEIAVEESQIRSGGRRLTSNGPFIGSHYHTGEPEEWVLTDKIIFQSKEVFEFPDGSEKAIKKRK